MCGGRGLPLPLAMLGEIQLTLPIAARSPAPRPGRRACRTPRRGLGRPFFRGGNNGKQRTSFRGFDFCHSGDQEPNCKGFLARRLVGGKAIGRRKPLTEIADHRHRLLRTRRQPPCAHCAGKGNNEMASSHAHPLFQPPARDYGLVGGEPIRSKNEPQNRGAVGGPACCFR